MASITHRSTVSESQKNGGVHTIVIHLNGLHMGSSDGCPSSGNVSNMKDFQSERLTTNGSIDREFYTPQNDPPLSRLATKCHPRADQVCTELDAFFSKHWPWENERARAKFLATDTNRWACWVLPLAKDDRIFDSVKVNTLFFLLDGKLLCPCHT